MQRLGAMGRFASTLHPSQRTVSPRLRSPVVAATGSPENSLPSMRLYRLRVAPSSRRWALPLAGPARVSPHNPCRHSSLPSALAAALVSTPFLGV